MKHAIFIRSYIKDIDWLRFCLRSIAKFVSDCDAVVVAVPFGEVKEFRDAGIEVVGCESLPRDYVGQQLTKHHADEFCFINEADCWITFLDSDNIFTEPFSLKSLFVNGRPILLHTPYAMLPPDLPWKPITEKAMGFIVHDEYMRRHGMTYSASELKDFRIWFEKARGESIDSYLQKVSGNDYSEFNALGAFMWKFRHDNRHWIRTDVQESPKLPLRQGHSWSGIASASEEWERILA